MDIEEIFKERACINYEQESERIKDTLQYVFDGIDNIDGKIARKAYHPKAEKYGTGDEGFGGMKAIEWAKNFYLMKEDPTNPLHQPKSKKIIHYIDVSEAVAAAKIDMVFQDFMITCYYNLIKIVDRWFIINEVYNFWKTK